MTVSLPLDDRRQVLAAAEAIAAAVRDVPMRHFRSVLTYDSKADDSPVTVADRATEARLREEIAARFPDHGIYGEEYGAEHLDRDFIWVIDPIDGTKSFLSGVPLFGMLLAVLYKGEPIAGVIQMPGLKEIFSGGPGLGSRFNGRDIHCRTDVPLEKTFLCCNDLGAMVREMPETATRLMSTGHFLRTTSDCYPFAQMAAGWVDGVIDLGLQPYDYLPVVGVIEGAGGIITDWKGQPLSLKSDGYVVAATTPEIHEGLLKVLAG